jgi:hypothetical protein
MLELNLKKLFFEAFWILNSIFPNYFNTNILQILFFHLIDEPLTVGIEVLLVSCNLVFFKKLKKF